MYDSPQIGAEKSHAPSFRQVSTEKPFKEKPLSQVYLAWVMVPSVVMFTEPLSRGDRVSQATEVHWNNWMTNICAKKVSKTHQKHFSQRQVINQSLRQQSLRSSQPMIQFWCRNNILNWRKSVSKYLFFRICSSKIQFREINCVHKI